MNDVRKKQRILITDPEDIKDTFESLEEASEYWDEHSLSEEVLDRLPDAPELDEALELSLQSKMDEESRQKAQEVYDLSVAFSELVNDYATCVELSENQPDSQFWFRITVRTFFSIVELFTYSLKKILLYYHHVRKIELSTAEIALLKEERYFLKDNGDFLTKPDKLRTQPNTVFAFKLFHSKLGTGLDLEVGNHGWQAFQNSLKIRDRFTHPKSLRDISVTVQDRKAVSGAMGFIAIAMKEVASKNQEISEQFIKK